MSEIERLRREVSLSDLAFAQGIALQKNGQEWEGCCPFHQENTPSFTIFRGKDGVERFHCFGCSAQGDVIDFVQQLKGLDTKGAIAFLGGGMAVANVAPKRLPEARDVYAGIELLVPVADIVRGEELTVYNPKRETMGRLTPSMVFPYFRPDGEVLGYVLRHDLRGGDKETPMVCWVRLPDGSECWSRFPFPRPRPLYRWERLRDGQVFVVEGEKCADALVLGTGRQAVSWAGGTFGIRHTDWSPLAGRDVIVWPDADKPGLATGDEIGAILSGLGCRVRVMAVPVAA